MYECSIFYKYYVSEYLCKNFKYPSSLNWIVWHENIIALRTKKIYFVLKSISFGKLLDTNIKKIFCFKIFRIQKFEVSRHKYIRV